MGRKREWHEDIRARFALGTLQRIENVLESSESRLAFVRQAVDNEIARRAERAKIATPKRKAS